MNRVAPNKIQPFSIFHLIFIFERHQRKDDMTPKLINLKGLVFGKLTVVALDAMIENQGASWICNCACGRDDRVVVSAGNLKSGRTVSCKKCKYEKTSKSHLVDLTGMRFGWLDVISFSRIENKSTFWNCFCNPKYGGCGNSVKVTAGNLKGKKTTSCGCRYESAMATELKNYFTKNYKAKTEYKILKNKDTQNWLPFDIYIPYGNNILINGAYIEVHGLQHYEFTPRWHKKKEKFEYSQKLDKLKKNFAKKNGVYVEVDLRKIKTIEQAIEYIENIIGK